MAKKITKSTGWTVARIIKGKPYIDRTALGTRSAAIYTYNNEHYHPNAYKRDSRAGKVKAVRCTITAEVDL